MPKIRGIKPETWTDENFVDLSPLARLLFIGLWNYACDNGHVEDKPKQIKMRVLPADDCSANGLLAELAEHGRIVREGGWITIPTLRDHQRIDKRWFVACEKAGCEKPSIKKGDSQPAPRGGHDEATTRPRRERDVASRGPRDDVDVDGDLMVTRGDSSSATDVADAPLSTQLALVPNDRPDVERICQHLAERIEANGSKRPSITKGWRDAARLMLDTDGRTEDEIHGAIAWCQADEFWRSNVLSLPKLRQKFDTLRLQAQRPAGSTGRRNDIDWDVAMDRARAMGGQQ